MSHQHTTAPTNSNYCTQQPYMYTILIKQLKSARKKLNKKFIASYWLRYFFRRIPLFFCAGFIFYATCFAMTLNKEIDLESANSFLKSQSANLNAQVNNILTFINAHIGNHITQNIDRYWVFIASLFLLFLVYISVCLVASLAIKTITKAVTNILLFSLSTSIFLITISNELPLTLGFILFSTATLTSVIIDRVLGFTRRNERYKLFSDRAKGLCNSLHNKQIAGIPFDESNLLEVTKFHEELRLIKHKDTASDSNYLLSIMEKLKGLSK